MNRLSALATGLLLLLAGCGGGDASRWDKALARMREQPRYDRYEASRVFPDGKVLQAPPPGTVAREAELGPPEIVTGQRDGSPLQRIPLPVTAELLERGASRFQIFCAACHGSGGFGGSVVAANWPGRRPPSLHDPRIAARPPGYVFQVITRGFGRMPSYAAELPPRDRWAVIAYLRQIQQQGARHAGASEDSLRAEILHQADSMPRPGLP